MKKSIGVCTLFLALLSSEGHTRTVRFDLKESQQEMLKAREAFLKAAFSEEQVHEHLQRERGAFSQSKDGQSNQLEVKLVRNSGN